VNTSRRSVKLMWLMAAVLVLGLAGYGVLRHGGKQGGAASARIADPAPFTPDLPEVERLRAAAKGRNVVICVLDAARADHFTCYGYPRDTTPNSDRVAEGGLLLENHFCPCPETKPSTASLFTGQYPDTHLAYDERKLQPGTFTLAQAFHSAGFHTVLFSQNEYSSPLWGLGEDFDEAYYEPHLRKAGWERPFYWRPDALLQQVSLWLAKKPRSPFFAYVHFMPPHSPYIAPVDIYGYYMDSNPPNARREPYPFDEVERELRASEKPWDLNLYVNRYDGNLRYGDMAIGQLEQMLRDAGLFDNTVFIVTADHGEAFGEHGYKGHTISVFDESTHVPLLIRFPDNVAQGRRIHGMTQTLDLLPTLCDLFEIPYPRDAVQGRSFLPLMAGAVEEINDFIFSRGRGKPPSYAVRDHDHLLLLYQGAKLQALYDLREDPRALKNVIAKEAEARLTDEFRSFAKQQTAPPLEFADPNAQPAQLPAVETVKPDEEMLRTIRALGYLK
jgi:arylsulfatase A-like enzyme